MYNRAIEEKEDDYSMDGDDENSDNNNNNPYNGSESLNTVASPKGKIHDINFKLAIAYNNCAIEYEYIGELQLALDCFLSAIVISEKIFGKGDEHTE